mmetsp:Transcript_57543/g.154549  ORF Transcript_57543/g.154549 Transcript_57543/m.154549 type:complete len:305 (-) Transcript_57543:549-1463(-)
MHLAAAALLAVAQRRDQDLDAPAADDGLPCSHISRGQEKAIHRVALGCLALRARCWPLDRLHDRRERHLRQLQHPGGGLGAASQQRRHAVQAVRLVANIIARQERLQYSLPQLCNVDLLCLAAVGVRKEHPNRGHEATQQITVRARRQRRLQDFKHHQSGHHNGALPAQAPSSVAHASEAHQPGFLHVDLATLHKAQGIVECLQGLHILKLVRVAQQDAEVPHAGRPAPARAPQRLHKQQAVQSLSDLLGHGRDGDGPIGPRRGPEAAVVVVTLRLLPRGQGYESLEHRLSDVCRRLAVANPLQ